MGLDQYAYAAARDQLVNPDADFDLEPKEKDVAPVAIAYWRKFNPLQGWMERLYQERGGNETFNCVSLQLRAADIDRLEHDTLAGKVKTTQGVVFGGEWEREEIQTAIFEFLPKARAALAEGKVLMYDSWW